MTTPVGAENESTPSAIVPAEGFVPVTPSGRASSRSTCVGSPPGVSNVKVTVARPSQSTSVVDRLTMTELPPKPGGVAVTRTCAALNVSEKQSSVKKPTRAPEPPPPSV